MFFDEVHFSKDVESLANKVDKLDINEENYHEVDKLDREVVNTERLNEGTFQLHDQSILQDEQEDEAASKSNIIDIVNEDVALITLNQI